MFVFVVCSAAVHAVEIFGISNIKTPLPSQQVADVERHRGDMGR